MLFDPARHEPLREIEWDAARARAAIEAIVRDAEAHYTPQRGWPVHPKDLEPGEDPQQPSPSLYYGAAGVIWALRYLHAAGAVAGRAAWQEDLPALAADTRAWLASMGSADTGSYLMGELPVALMAQADAPASALAQTLPALLEQTLDHPARELMWGAPGALLAASFLHQRSGEARWAALYRRVAATLRSQLQWSDAHGCHYWEQDLYGRRSTYLDAVHGFVATAHGLIRGRHLLDAADWAAWQDTIVTTVARTALREQGDVNWPAMLIEPAGRPPRLLMQFCHGAPGFVICLARLPAPALDELLVAAGETVWKAGPLTKGAGLCHGTAGNGYAFLALHVRTGEARWLERARAYAMHALAQSEADAARFGQRRHSLWTGDPGLAVYLWDCLRGRADFPTLDVFDGAMGA